MLLQSRRMIGRRHHPTLSAQARRSDTPRRVHRQRIAQPVALQRPALWLGRPRRREGDTGGLQHRGRRLGNGIVAGELQEPPHRAGVARRVETGFGGDAVAHVGELVERRRQQLDQHDLHVPGGPAPPLGKARRQLLQHDPAEPVIVARPPVEIVAHRRQRRWQGHPALAAVGAAARDELQDRPGKISHRHLPHPNGTGAAPAGRYGSARSVP